MIRNTLPPTNIFACNISVGGVSVRGMLLSAIGFGCYEALLIIFNIVFFFKTHFCFVSVVSLCVQTTFDIGKRKWNLYDVLVHSTPNGMTS
jgi:hypothetical protein